jgi:predicted MPP superfamily phosphohydrolase
MEAFRGVARLGNFGINGNHDGDLITSRLEACGVTSVVGRRLRLTWTGGQCDLLGLPGTWRGGWRGLSSLRRDESKPLIAMGHYPDEIRRLRHLRPDVYLAGHTHGGQIAMPNRAATPLVTHDSLPRPMSSGIHDVHGTWLCVSRGIGTTRLHCRFNCPPEVLDLRLVEDSAADESV